MLDWFFLRIDLYFCLRHKLSVFSWSFPGIALIFVPETKAFRVFPDKYLCLRHTSNTYKNWMISWQIHQSLLNIEEENTSIFQIFIMAISRKSEEIYQSVIRFLREYKEDKSCSCEYCLKTFDHVSAFFRHVSHAKSCSDHYGKEYVECMRKQLRSISKRKWHETNKDNNKNAKKKSYYFPNSKRYTTEGRAFETVFRGIFYEFRNIARGQIEEYSKDKSNFVNEDDVDKALDETFDWDYDWELFRYDKEVNLDKELDNEEDNLNLFFTALEKRFKSNLRSIHAWDGKGAYEWVKNQRRKIGSELWTYCSNRAFLTVYREEEFKQLIESSQDAALDEVFSKLIVTEHYFKDDMTDAELEDKMAKVFSTITDTEVMKKCEENGITAKLRVLMDGIMKERIYCDDLEFLNQNAE